MATQTEQLIFSFDIGTGSLGEAVRRGNKFLHKESLLVPHTLARRGPAKIAGTPAPAAFGGGESLRSAQMLN